VDQIVAGKSPYHFIEIMGCPGGCITGGGQPRSTDPDIRMKRMKALYSEDESKTLRKSHENPYIISFYKEFLGEPNGHTAHELLHTTYVNRGKFNEYTDETFELEIPYKKKQQAKEKTYSYAASDDKNATVILREAPEQIRILNLESENKKLKSELEDTLETVDILKRVIADYTKKWQGESSPGGSKKK